VTSFTSVAPKVTAQYELHPKQKEAMRLLGLGSRLGGYTSVEELLYGGQAGGGKSALMRCVALTLAIRWPGSRVPIFRRTYPELEDTHIVACQKEWNGWGSYHGGTHEWRHPNGSVTPFRHCEREFDVYRYLSSEWDGLLIDEATEFTEFQITALRSRVRSPRPRWRPIILYTANPGGVGHLFFKEHFVDAGREGVPYMGGGFRRAFLRAKLSDNPSLPQVEYERILSGISDEQMRKALMEGDWNLFAGQFLRWLPDQHTCAPFEIPLSWYRRYITTDWGFGAPWATYFLVRDEDLWRRDRIPRWYAYREFYETQVRDQQQARLIRDAMRDDEAGRGRAHEKIVWDAVCDPAMWTKQSQTNVSPADIYRSEMIPIMPANNDRVPGWQRVREYMDEQEDGLPGLIFFDNCEDAIRTLPALVRDKHHPEDIDSHGEDHSADAIRYFCMTQAGLTRAEGSHRVAKYQMDAGPRRTREQTGAGSNAQTQKTFDRALAAAQGAPDKRSGHLVDPPVRPPATVRNPGPPPEILRTGTRNRH
jgi:hypothetical protein